MARIVITVAIPAVFDVAESSVEFVSRFVVSVGFVAFGGAEVWIWDGVVEEMVVAGGVAGGLCGEAVAGVEAFVEGGFERRGEQQEG